MKREFDPAQNDSKGCGGVMRVAPVGLFFDHGSIFSNGETCARLTHGHPTGFLAAGAFAELIGALKNGMNLLDALAAAKTRLASESARETRDAIEAAERLAASDLTPDAAIAQLGQGWVAEEALAIAIYAALVARDFRHGIMLAVNHDGDSDSTGAIAGNILGTVLGERAIPAEWLDSLELRGVITEIADDLHDYPDWDIGAYGKDRELDERICKKYPGY
jgi:ADP-ribosylglycohydrolase